MNEQEVSSETAALASGASPVLGTPTLISTKIQVPRRRPDLLPRQRMLNFLHAHMDRKLILVSAPAGYGKTTLLSDFAHDTDLPVCWYTLDSFDQDLRLFLEYLISSIALRFPAFGSRSRTVLRQMADPGSSLYPLVAVLVQEIYETIPEYFCIILDDHHTVEDQEQINAFLDLFLTYVDENCHVILASRTLPALPNLSLLVARRQAAGLSIDELRFSAREIQALARQNYGLTLTYEQAELLAQRTGGWITGLLLTAAPRWKQAQHEVPLRGRISLDLYDYLSRQVLDQQPASLRDFLLASSVLDELSAELCTAVLGYEDPEAMLGQLRARNLFVTEYEADDPRLRYHALFHDFLQSSLRRQDEQRFHGLTRRAAEAYAAREKWEQAISRYLALKEHEQAADIVSRTAAQMYETGRWDTLTGWIEALPETTQAARPELALYLGQIHMERGDYAQAATSLARAEQAYTAAGDWGRVAYVLTSQGTMLRFQGRYAESIACCQKALALVSSTTGQENRAVAHAQKNIGLSRLGQGKLAEGQDSLLQALRIYEEQGAPYDVAMVYHDLGLSHELAGDLAAAVDRYRAALQHWQALGTYGPWANTLNGLGVIYYLQGQYEQALPVLNEALSKAQQAGDLRVAAYTWASLGDLYRDLGAYERASQSYTQAYEVAGRLHIGFIVTYALNAMGNTQRLRGDTIQARDLLHQALQQAESHNAGYEIALCRTSLGILDAQEGDLAAARRHLDMTVQFFESSGMQQELSRAYLHRAHISFREGRLDEALADLQQTFSLAAPLGADQFLVVEGQYLQPLLNYATEQDVGGDFLHRLLGRIRSHQTRLAAHPEPLPAEEPEPALEIHALGKPRVEKNGQTVQWTLTLSRDLLFCLLQHPLGLHRDQLGEIFWPEHSPAKLEGAFRSTLYRLRRSLARNSILFEDGSYRFNWSAGYSYDVEVFERKLDQASQPTAPERVTELLEAAIALYQGDYLEGVYTDWSTLERERLRTRYLAAVETLAGLYAERRNLPRAIELFRLVLKHDPYREAAHRELMRCYFRRGDRAAAIRQYQACAQVLREDLGLSPSHELEALYLQVIA